MAAEGRIGQGDAWRRCLFEGESVPDQGGAGDVVTRYEGGFSACRCDLGPIDPDGDALFRTRRGDDWCARADRCASGVSGGRMFGRRVCSGAVERGG